MKALGFKKACGKSRAGAVGQAAEIQGLLGFPVSVVSDAVFVVGQVSRCISSRRFKWGGLSAAPVTQKRLSALDLGVSLGTTAGLSAGQVTGVGRSRGTDAEPARECCISLSYGRGMKPVALNPLGPEGCHLLCVSLFLVYV